MKTYYYVRAICPALDLAVSGTYYTRNQAEKARVRAARIMSYPLGAAWPIMTIETRKL